MTPATAPLIFEELQDFFEELDARLLEQHEVRRIGDQYALLDRRVDEVAHQALTVLGEGPSVEGSCNHQRWRIDVRRVPQRSAGCLIEGVLEHTVRSPQAWRIACTAGRIRRHALLPELARHGRIAILVLVFDRDLAVPATGVGGFRGQPIGAEASQGAHSRIALKWFLSNRAHRRWETSFFG